MDHLWKPQRFKCPLCNKFWFLACDNPEGHKAVPCPACLKQSYDHFVAELRHVEFALPLGYIEVPHELQALKLGHAELCRRLAAYRLGMPLEKLQDPALAKLD